MIENNRRSFTNLQGHKVLELGLSLHVGILSGALAFFSPYLPLSFDWQKLVFVIPIAILLDAQFNNLEKLILFTIAIDVPLNLDFAVMRSPYTRIPENVALGNRTVVALTDLRMLLIVIVVVVGYILWLVDRHGAGRRTVRFFTGTSIPALGLILISILSMFQSQDVQLSFFKIAQLVELFLVYFNLAKPIFPSRIFAAPPVPNQGETSTITIHVASSSPESDTISLTNTIPAGLSYDPGTLTAAVGVATETAGVIQRSSALQDRLAVDIQYKVTMVTPANQVISNNVIINTVTSGVLSRTGYLCADFYSAFLPLLKR